jgi:hypothetical protein
MAVKNLVLIRFPFLDAFALPSFKVLLIKPVFYDLLGSERARIFESVVLAKAVIS